MVFHRTDSLRVITDGLGRIVHACELRGLVRLFDDHVQAQHFFCRLLNAAYDLQLQQMDQIQANHPAIDLGDPVNRVSYQITAEKCGEKVQHTLDKFVEHGLQATYDTLKILVIGARQATYKAVVVPAETQFDCDRDILGIADLVRHLSTLSTPRLKEVEAIMNMELVPVRNAEPPPVTGLLPESLQFLALACECEGADKGKMVLTYDLSGWYLRCGNQAACFPHTDRQAQARCRAALDQLLERKLIADTGCKAAPGGNLLGWYVVQHEGYLLAAGLLNQRRAGAKGGSVNISGGLTAGSGKDGPGGHVIAEGGAGRGGASGGDVNVGPGNYTSGDGGRGPGGSIILKGGDAE